MKFGGASLSTTDHIINSANIILDRALKYPNLIVVVSAMGGMTDKLFDLAEQVCSYPPKREQDMLISVGERISMSLLAMALFRKKREAMSFTGSQSGIISTEEHSDARIIDVRPHRLRKALSEGKIVIVAGFQGVSLQGEITTLGRGGSDTTAVALGVALSAEKVEFYKDVMGVYTKDPKKNNDAKLLAKLNFNEALKLSQEGAQVLHPRSILLASKNQLPLHVLPFDNTARSTNVGTLIGSQAALQQGDMIYENSNVSEVAP